MKKRIILTEEDFKTLVSGGVVDKEGIQIILQDIGYSNMINIISWPNVLIPDQLKAEDFEN